MDENGTSQYVNHNTSRAACGMDISYHNSLKSTAKKS